MVIFRDYTTDELVMNLPCDIGDNIKIYPVAVKDYKQFTQYVKYIMYSKKHLNLYPNMTLLQEVLIVNMLQICGNGILNSSEGIKATNIVLNEFSNLLSLITKENIKGEISKDGSFEFYNKDKTIAINDKNFNILRMVTLKMNMIREPKIYEREIDKKWEEKALLAKSKNSKNIELGEILTIVRNVTHEKYEELIEMNTFQLYCDYFRIQHVVNHEDTRLYATVNDKVKPSDFIESVVEFIYKDPTKDLNVKNDFTKYI